MCYKQLYQQEEISSVCNEYNTGQSYFGDIATTSEPTIFFLMNDPGAMQKTCIVSHYFVPKMQSKNSDRFCISLFFRD